MDGRRNFCTNEQCVFARGSGELSECRDAAGRSRTVHEGIRAADKLRARSIYGDGAERADRRSLGYGGGSDVGGIFVRSRTE